MRELDYGEKKAYELELLLAKATQRELDKSGLTTKEFAKAKGISYGILKHSVLENLKDFHSGNTLKFVAETFHKLGYELKFVVVEVNNL